MASSWREVKGTVDPTGGALHQRDAELVVEREGGRCGIEPEVAIDDPVGIVSRTACTDRPRPPKLIRGVTALMSGQIMADESRPLARLS